MRRIAYFLSMVFLLSSLAPAAMAKEGKEPEVLSPEAELRLKEINNRVEEIKAMNFAEMGKSERKEIKKELREINKEAKAIGGGIYLSVGAVIIILLILILIT